MSSDWEKDLTDKEHSNWVSVGCALNIAKKGIETRIQTDIVAWHTSLCTNQKLNLPCSCAKKKCARCCEWEKALKSNHRKSNPNFPNCCKEDWNKPTTGPWEVAKAFMPLMGKRKSDTTSAKTTDLGGLLNILSWCTALASSVVDRKFVEKVRDDGRNLWAHAPTQKICDAVTANIFGYIHDLLRDPVFTADAEAKKALIDLQDLQLNGVRNIRESELKNFIELRKTLLEQHQDLVEARRVVKDFVDHTKRINQLEKEIECFNKSISRRELQNDVRLIKVEDDVKVLSERVTVLEEKKQIIDLSCNIPQKIQFFTGRKKELKCLNQEMKNAQSAGCTCVVISGLGGVGKTSLALEFAHQAKTQFPGGKYWINAENEVNIENSVIEILSPQLNTEMLKLKSSGKTRLLLSSLQKKKQPWLLIVDNADQLDNSRCPESLKIILKWPFQGNIGSILLTSRLNKKETENVLENLVRFVLSLKCMSQEDATTFLVAKCGSKGSGMEEEERKDAEKLAQELGCLPLALAQSAAYIAKSPLKVSVDDYLEKYRQIQEKNPVQPLKDEDKQRRSVSTTWLINIEMIQRECPAAETLLKISAFLESNAIPVAIINPGKPKIEDAYKQFRENARSTIDRIQILETLTKYSIVKHVAESEVFSIHKLVQDVIINLMELEERKTVAFLALEMLHKAFIDLKSTSALEDIIVLRSNFVALEEHAQILGLRGLQHRCSSFSWKCTRMELLKIEEKLRKFEEEKLRELAEIMELLKLAEIMELLKEFLKIEEKLRKLAEKMDKGKLREELLKLAEKMESLKLAEKMDKGKLREDKGKLRELAEKMELLKESLKESLKEYAKTSQWEEGGGAGEGGGGGGRRKRIQELAEAAKELEEGKEEEQECKVS